MRKERRLITLLLILIPLALGLLGQPLPTALEHSSSLRELQQAVKTGDLPGEITAIESVLAFTPWRGELWQRAGRLFLDTGQVERAISAFERANGLNQLQAQGYLWWADALVASGKAEEARKVITQAQLSDPNLLKQAAFLLRSAGDLEGAREYLVNTNLQDPDDDEVNYQLGVLLAADEPESAARYLQQVNTTSARSTSANYLLGKIGQKTTITVRTDWYTFIGQALSQVGEWDAARLAFQAVVADDPENALGWALLGEAQQQLGEDGKVSLDTAVALDPDGELVNGLLGLYFHRQGETEKALTSLQNALKANPQAGIWLIEMGDTLADAGRLEEALIEYQNAVEVDRKNPEYWAALAKFTLSHNYQVQESGIGAARQAVVLSPKNPVYLDLLGTAYLLLGDTDNAERFFNQALEYDPEQAAILIHLGQVSLLRGDKETAIAFWQRASASAVEDRLKELAEQLLLENGAR